MGKSFDTHGPIGPWITTADEVGDPHALRVRTWVNGERRQDSSTKNLIFDCFAIVEHLSTAFTLEPGDVVATGTPGGVGITMKPPKLITDHAAAHSGGANLGPDPDSMKGANINLSR